MLDQQSRLVQAMCSARESPGAYQICSENEIGKVESNCHYAMAEDTETAAEKATVVISSNKLPVIAQLLPSQWSIRYAIHGNNNLDR